jgi:glucose/arabinose dehydrogenase
MRRKLRRKIVRFPRIFSNVLRTAGLALLMACPVAAETEWQIQPVIAGLDTPWAVAPLPEGGALVTERDGALIFAKDGITTSLGGVPAVDASGQGGLLDITLARDFAQSRTLFLTFAKPQQGGGSGTAVVRAQWPAGSEGLQNVQEIFAMKPGSRGGRHFGSRVVEAADGTLFVTIGDRGDRPSAQDLGSHNGSVIRIAKDGSIPADNPFANGDGALPEIWSWGHRNPQGAGLDLQGNLWVAEHGARGGDEVNAVRKGANYGWPVISYGRHYSGAKIGEGTARDGMEQPVFYWDPSIAPSGLLVYSGKAFAQWRGDMFVGSLKFDYISRLSGDPLREVEQIKTPETIRVRDIVEAPDGTIWFISVGEGAVYRISPQ